MEGRRGEDERQGRAGVDEDTKRGEWKRRKGEEEKKRRGGVEESKGGGEEEGRRR